MHFKRNIGLYILTAVLLLWQLKLTAQEPSTEKSEDLTKYMEDGMKEIDFYSLEELLNVEVEVASLFAEDELVVGSTVSAITPVKWKRLGARRLHEAFNNEMSVMVYPVGFGSYILAIRGFSQLGSDKGISTLLDGVPLNDIVSGSAWYLIPNWELGTLDSIEMIKGPGSSIFGSDAFHGVISLKTFESDKNFYSAECSGAYPLYGDASLKLSQGFANNFLRIDFSAGASRQGDQELEYEYSDPVGVPLLNIPDAEGTAYRKFKYNSQNGILKININPSQSLKIKIGGYLARGEYEDFPGAVKTYTPFINGYINFQDKDLSSMDTLLIMGNGSIIYTLYNRISIETSGYSWVSEKSYITDSIRRSGAETDQESSRKGGKIIIKQPDNPINLQWLIAYEFSTLDLKKSETKYYSINHTFLSERDDYDTGLSRNINSAFCQVKWGFIKNTAYLLFGGRYDRYSDFGNQMTPRGGFIYLPDRNSSIKVLYGRAFRAPSTSEQSGMYSYSKGDDSLKPEIIDTYEVGYIYKKKEWKLSVGTFFNKWTNGIILEQASELQPDYILKYINKGENQSYGCDANLFYPVKPITFDLGFSYVKSSAIGVKDPVDPDKLIDQEYAAFPEYSINVGIYYTLKPLELMFYLNNRIYLDMKEAPLSMNPDAERLPPYYRIDLNISRIFAERAELYLDVRNLLNRKNRVPSLYGAIDGYVEPGTSILLRAGYKL